MPEEIKKLESSEIEKIQIALRSYTGLFLDEKIMNELYEGFVAEQSLLNEYCKDRGDFVNHFSNSLKKKGKEIGLLVAKPIGDEKVKTISNEIWNDEIWTEQTIKQNNLQNKKNLLQKMKEFNAIVANEKINNFETNDYKSKFLKWVSNAKNQNNKNFKEADGTPLTKL